MATTDERPARPDRENTRMFAAHVDAELCAKFKAAAKAHGLTIDQFQTRCMVLGLEDLCEDIPNARKVRMLAKLDAA